MPTTPLRRISRGSLNALSHSASKQLSAGATPLSFLQGAMTDLAEEAGVLQLNLENVEAVHESLHSFKRELCHVHLRSQDERVLRRVAEAPLHDNFERAEKRIAQQAQQYAAQHNLDLASDRSRTATAAATDVQSSSDQTYVTTDDESIYRNEAPRPLQSSLCSSLRSRSHPTQQLLHLQRSQQQQQPHQQPQEGRSQR